VFTCILVPKWFTLIALCLCAVANPVVAVDPPADLWSAKPLARPAVPIVAGVHGLTWNSIDSFIGAKLELHGLRLSPEADRRTLIRRLYFDLVGLPPTPAEIERFVNDPATGAYDALVDRLLASSDYGERWARHWLDVVHFGETHGYDKDKLRLNAWPYRDYVIRSFNEDKPWSRFVEEQIAGDVLYPFTRDGVEALGFISAGPWDFIGHAEVPETKIDGKVARHLDRDDMVANTMQSFNSLTAQCAQCHDHKFDPIAQEDYYSLQAVFAAVDRADREYDLDENVARTRADLKSRQTPLLSEQKEINDRITDRAGATLVELNESIKSAETMAKKGEAFGYHSSIEVNQEAAKWVQVDLGRPVLLRKIVLHPARDDFNRIGDGFGFPIRYKVEVAGDADFTSNVRSLINQKDVDVVNPGITPQSFELSDVQAQFVRITATKLAPRQNDFIFALAELSAIDESGTNVALGKAVTSLDSIEAPARWQKANLTDGWFPGISDVDSAELANLRSAREKLLARSTHEEETKRLAEISVTLEEVVKRIEELPPPQRVFVASVYSGSGTFKGTGGDGGRPRPVHVLNRGSVLSPGKEVGPGTVHAIPELPSRFDVGPDAPEGERRAALARWLSDPRNPLTWRSIVNRVWQQHFGRGIVDTPNDFGNMGGKPSHPELLDWLACEFRDGGQSLKELNRLMVTSATYKQRSVNSGSVVSDQSVQAQTGSGLATTDSLNTHYSGRAAAIDSDNRLLWHMNRRKLEAESVRDAMLLVSGKLDRTLGGPSFQDFVIEKPEHSPHYEYRLHDPEDPKAHRRSIYRFLVRSQPQPFMAALDCPDPSMQVAHRNQSVTALQSLALLNNALVVTLSKHFADRLNKTNRTVHEKTIAGFYAAIGRPPTEEEAEQLTRFAEEFGLENFCRALFNLNEFAFVD
jgi:hypothetical protein